MAKGKKTATVKSKRPPKADRRQTAMPGAIRSHPALDKLVERMDETSEAISEARAADNKVRVEVGKAMRDLGLESYRTPSGLTATRTERDDVVRLTRDKPSK
jgi:hypothetical protein